MTINTHTSTHAGTLPVPFTLLLDAINAVCLSRQFRMPSELIPFALARGHSPRIALALAIRVGALMMLVSAPCWSRIRRWRQSLSTPDERAELEAAILHLTATAPVSTKGRFEPEHFMLRLLLLTGHDQAA
jgi:hypothetical protein